MRDYAKVMPTFWTGETGKAIRRRGPEGVICALYLMSSPASNMLGLYYQPILYMAHETGLGVERASEGLRVCIEEGLCSYDEGSEFVWVHEMATFQIGKGLKASDNRCVGVQRDYDSLPDNPFLGAFFDRYKADFHLTRRRGSEGPSRPLSSQEQEQEQEQEEEQSSLRSDSQPPADAVDLLPDNPPAATVHPHPGRDRPGCLPPAAAELPAHRGAEPEAPAAGAGRGQARPPAVPAVGLGVRRRGLLAGLLRAVRR